MDDIFKTIKLISNYLPKKKLLTIYTKNLKNNNFIQSDIKIQTSNWTNTPAAWAIKT